MIRVSPHNDRLTSTLVFCQVVMDRLEASTTKLLWAGILSEVGKNGLSAQVKRLLELKLGKPLQKLSGRSYSKGEGKWVLSGLSLPPIATISEGEPS